MRKKLSIAGILFFLGILWIIYLANTGAQNILFNMAKSIPFGDKLGHFILFGLFTFFSILLFKLKSLSFLKIKIYYGTLFTIAFVIIEEFSQKYITTRTFDFIDLSADFVGILFVALTMPFLEHYFYQKKL